MVKIGIITYLDFCVNLTHRLEHLHVSGFVDCLVCKSDRECAGSEVKQVPDYQFLALGWSLQIPATYLRCTQRTYSFVFLLIELHTMG
jgi:hypothetical protein